MRSAHASAPSAAELFYVKDVLDAGDAAYGMLVTSWTVGMVAGAVGLARRVPPGALAAGALAAVAVQGAGIAGGAAGVLWAAFAGYTIGGVAHGVKNVLLRTLIHERVPEAARGRAFALYNAARNAAELGALGAAGALIGAIGPQAALVLAGTIPLALGAGSLLLITTRPRWRTAHRITPPPRWRTVRPVQLHARGGECFTRSASAGRTP